MLCASWQNTLMTFWPFIISCTKPSVSATERCCFTKKRAEPPPKRLATKNISTTPANSTRVIHTLKYSMIASTTSTIAPDCISVGSDWLISMRRVSMSFV